MDLPNAFVGCTTPPSQKQVATALGSSDAAWRKLLTWLNTQGIVDKGWKSVSPKYGWALRPELKKRTILYLGPCRNCFRVSFVFGDKAIVAALASDLPKVLLNEIAVAKRYAEGTGVRLIVRTVKDLAPVKELVAIKLAH